MVGVGGGEIGEEDAAFHGAQGSVVCVLWGFADGGEKGGDWRAGKEVEGFCGGGCGLRVGEGGGRCLRGGVGLGGGGRGGGYEGLGLRGRSGRLVAVHVGELVRDDGDDGADGDGVEYLDDVF